MSKAEESAVERTGEDSEFPRRAVVTVEIKSDWYLAWCEMSGIEPSLVGFESYIADAMGGGFRSGFYAVSFE